MTVNRGALAGALATLLLVAACGGGASPTPAASAGSSEAPAATPAETPAETPAAQETPGSTFEVSFAPGAATDLEAKLPDSVGSIKFTKTSVDGRNIPPGVLTGSDSDMDKFLAANGKSYSDVRVAIATPTDPTAAGVMVFAIQIQGISSDKLLEWAHQQWSSDQTKQSIGGKDVYGDAPQGGMGSWFYVKDDTVFNVAVYSGPPNLAEQIFADLP